MSVLILPHRLQQQPAQMLPIDWSNPLTAGLVMAVLPGLHRGFDLGARRPSTIVGTKVQALAPGIAGGFGATLGAGTTDRITTTIAGTMPATGRTYYFRARRNGTGGGNFGRLFDKTNGGTGQMLYWYDSSLVLNYSTYIGGVEILFGIPGTATTAAIGATFDVIVTHLQTGNTPTINAYVNGVQVLTNATSGASGSFSDTTTALTIGNRASDGIRGWDGLIECAYAWNRILSPVEAARLYQNRYQLFKAPVRRLWRAGGAASGSINPTLVGATLAATGIVRATGPFSSTLGGAALAATGTVGTPVASTFASTLAGASMTVIGQGENRATFAAQLTGATAAFSASAENRGAFNTTLGSATLSAAGTIAAISSTFNTTLDGATLSAGGYVGIPPEASKFFQRLPKNPRHHLPLQ